MSPPDVKNDAKKDKDVMIANENDKRKYKNMWLDNLKEMKKAKGMSSKQIAEATNLPERTVVRIFSGDTDNPYMDTLHRIVSVLDGSLDDLFAECKTVIGTKDIATLQAEVDRIKAENAMLAAENDILKCKVATLTSENALISTKLEHKEEIIRLHNYYNSLMSGMVK